MVFLNWMVPSINPSDPKKVETESVFGSAHVAFGNSIAYGGLVNAAAHLDCVMRDATVYFDGRPRIVEGIVVS